MIVHLQVYKHVSVWEYVRGNKNKSFSIYSRIKMKISAVFFIAILVVAVLATEGLLSYIFI